jgi:hypothetical protein
MSVELTEARVVISRNGRGPAEREAGLVRLLHGLSRPEALSPELRWKLAARGLSVETLWECLELLEQEATGLTPWPARS